MNVYVFYDNGRVDEFDVDHFTLSEPFDGRNMLTNFEVRFDDLETNSLWLQAHFYDIRPEYREGIEVDTTPVARRMRGWRFLLVDKSEMEHVAKIVVNGELVAWRQGEDLINAVRFHAQELLCYSDDTTSSINRKAIILHDYISNANPDIAGNEDEICRTFGFTRQAYERVVMAESVQPEPVEEEKEEEENWIDESFAKAAKEEAEEQEDDEDIDEEEW